VVEAAIKEVAVALAHGCTGKGNDQLRFEAVFRQTDMDVIAPMREMKPEPVNGKSITQKSTESRSKPQSPSPGALTKISGAAVSKAAGLKIPLLSRRKRSTSGQNLRKMPRTSPGLLTSPLKPESLFLLMAKSSAAMPLSRR